MGPHPNTKFEPLSALTRYTPHVENSVLREKEGPLRQYDKRAKRKTCSRLRRAAGRRNTVASRKYTSACALRFVRGELLIARLVRGPLCPRELLLHAVAGGAEVIYLVELDVVADLSLQGLHTLAA